MRTYRTQAGPFTERPYYTNEEIDQICSDELRAVDLFPSSPEPIRIDRFIEKRFKVSPQYDDLPAGVLGFTSFGPAGVQSIVISRALSEEGTRVSERRLNTTLAHEGGHGLLHAHLFGYGPPKQSLFAEDDFKSDPMRILCREEAVFTSQSHGHKNYTGRWWEFQANRAIGGLLLPKLLMAQCLERLLVPRGSLGKRVLPEEHRDRAVHLMAEVFDVNPAVARIRVDSFYSAEEERQLTL